MAISPPLASPLTDVLWIGYFDRGLDILSLAGEPSATHMEDDRIFCINRILPTPRVTPWTWPPPTASSSSTPLAIHARRSSRRDGLIADQITDIALTRNGLALATPAGLTFIDATGTH